VTVFVPEATACAHIEQVTSLGAARMAHLNSREGWIAK
jgi:hypothetical protein